MSLRCDRCGYDIPLSGLETAEARAALARSARTSRIGAIQWLTATKGYSLADGKVVMNHVTGETEAGARFCYKCGSTDILDGQPCPRCRSLALDW